MIPSTIAILTLACLLAILLTRGRRRLDGPPWARQLQLGLAAAVLVAGFGAWAVPRYGPDAPDAREVLRGVRDPARIQRAVDLEWAPPETREEMAAYAAARGWDGVSDAGGPAD